MARTKLTEDEGLAELEMVPGSDLPPLDEYDPGTVFGMGNTLPELPKIPGYHCAWAPVATEHVRDSNRWIAMHTLGYRPITVDEFNTYGIGKIADNYRVKDHGEFSGCVRIMDVVAVKIPQAYRNKITEYEEQKVIRTEADLRRTPHQMKGVSMSDVFVEHKTGAANSVGSVYDKL